MANLYPVADNYYKILTTFVESLTSCGASGDIDMYCDKNLFHKLTHHLYTRRAHSELMSPTCIRLHYGEIRVFIYSKEEDENIF